MQWKLAHFTHFTTANAVFHSISAKSYPESFLRDRGIGTSKDVRDLYFTRIAILLQHCLLSPVLSFQQLTVAVLEAGFIRTF
ncbi:hypothetical protein I312_102560 [Cryptococcus bacillisporus CA1280]|uniref:uncharacterized protein n=1 Tax=Cryptococcus bacillisporus CA1280 TaxID=1296109 RepID=UPI00336806E2